MYRAALRSTPRIANPLRQSYVVASGRRFVSTSPAEKGRTWKSSAVRWGLAIGAVYWYSTSAVFAEEPHLKSKQPPPQFSDEDLPTVEAVVAQKRREAEARLQKSAPESKSVPEPETASLATQTSPEAPVKDVETTGQGPPQEGGPEALEKEAEQQGAFNPETGEINWDCPCLGGMAHGPCGEEFKAAFSCFVYSEEEPKGMDCIDKFQHMQDCFRLHPEVYGEELADDDEAPVEGTATEAASAKGASEDEVKAAATKTSPESAKTAAPSKEPLKTEQQTSETQPELERGATTPSSPPAKASPRKSATTE
ncbi:hypothetical protein F5Y19DRAFT_219945 [Xylariaceae sp. FL1651]|nr:hypothetical protein F5Y19DRAFT_219945 [Xylariaceae sp. FL1651]